MHCSRCGRKAAEVLAVSRPRPSGVSKSEGLCARFGMADSHREAHQERGLHSGGPTVMAVTDGDRAQGVSLTAPPTMEF